MEPPSPPWQSFLAEALTINWALQTQNPGRTSPRFRLAFRKNSAPTVSPGQALKALRRLARKYDLCVNHNYFDVYGTVANVISTHDR